MYKNKITTIITILYLNIILLSNSANIQLNTFLNNDADGTVSLSTANTYILSSEYHITKNTIINGNGATISITGGGPLGAYDGRTLTLNHCIINAPSTTCWGAVAVVNSTLTISDNSLITCNYGSGVYASNSTLTIQNSTIQNSTYGINAVDDSILNLHAIAIIDSTFAVLISGGSATLTLDQNSYLQGAINTEGLCSMVGASITALNSTFVGFNNAINIQPGLESETVYVENCIFNHNYISSISTSDCNNVTFKNCQVFDCEQDGIYFSTSIATVENCTIVDSLNTGVTFWDCPGGIIKNSLIDGSIHQGIAVVAGTSNLKIIDNTLRNNVITSVLVDDTSSVYSQGNIFADTPDFNLRFQGGNSPIFDSSLISYAQRGIEMNQGTNPTLSLCSITKNNNSGILVYDNSSLTLKNVNFYSNSLSGTGNGYSVYINSGAQVYPNGCTIGPAWDKGVYNLAENTVNFTNCYWSAANGPADSITPTGGTGATVYWNPWYNPKSYLTYTPYLSSPYVLSEDSDTVSLSSNGYTFWIANSIAAYLEFTGKSGISTQTNKIVGILKCYNESPLTGWAFPQNFIRGGLFVVWVDYSLLANSSMGSVSFYVPETSSGAKLYRRNSNKVWEKQSAVWNSQYNLLIYQPSDLFKLSGTFAICEAELDIENWNFY